MSTRKMIQERQQVRGYNFQLRERAYSLIVQAGITGLALGSAVAMGTQDRLGLAALAGGVTILGAACTRKTYNALVNSE